MGNSLVWMLLAHLDAFSRHPHISPFYYFFLPQGSEHWQFLPARLTAGNDAALVRGQYPFHPGHSLFRGCLAQCCRSDLVSLFYSDRCGSPWRFYCPSGQLAMYAKVAAPDAGDLDDQVLHRERRQQILQEYLLLTCSTPRH